MRTTFVSTKQIKDMYKKLSEREQEVIDLITQGFRTKDIANRLYISVNTVETHRKHIIKKFESNNMMEAIAKYNSIKTKTAKIKSKI